jgi:hypothetical protein
MKSVKVRTAVVDLDVNGRVKIKKHIGPCQLNTHDIPLSAVVGASKLVRYAS